MTLCSAFLPTPSAPDWHLDQFHLAGLVGLGVLDLHVALVIGCGLVHVGGDIGRHFVDGRRGHGLAETSIDGSNGIVLFGGNTEAGSIIDDTWVSSSGLGNLLVDFEKVLKIGLNLLKF